MACNPARHFLIAVACAAATLAGTRSAQAQGFGLGHPPAAARTLAEVDVLPDGRGLPPGRGTAVEGEPIYRTRCASCHGPAGTEGPNDALAGGAGTLASPRPVRTVGSYWPYATTLWDYINRAMPFAQPRTLSADQVYAVTAYILSLNGIVARDAVMSPESLPLVQMPNRNGFIPDTRSNEHLPRR